MSIPETSYWQQAEDRRQFLGRMVRWTLALTAIQHAPELLNLGLDLFEMIRLEQARESRWVTSNSLYPVEDGLVHPSTKITLGDSLGKGFVANNQPDVCPDTVVTTRVNTYLANDTWENLNFAQVGATTQDVLTQLQDDSEVVNALQQRSNIDVTLSLLGNDLGAKVLRDFGSFEAFQQFVESPWNAFRVVSFFIDAFSQYGQNVQKIIERLDELRLQGADIKRVIISGPPNFSKANGVSVRIPHAHRRGYETKLVKLQGNDSARKFGAVLSIELLNAQTGVLNAVGDRVGFECLIVDNFGITQFSLDQHLLPAGYAQMATNQTNRFIGKFGKKTATFTQEILSRAA